MTSGIINSVDALFGDKIHPYFIYTPRWIDQSAGIKVLHLLCHALNLSGQQAYLVFTEPCFLGQPRINPNLKTPILTSEVIDAFFTGGISPIVIYSETIPGNPLDAEVIVRYLLNFPGKLGGQTAFEKDASIWAYSNSISQEYEELGNDIPPKVLYLPAIDPRDFAFTLEKEHYQTSYAGKYRAFVGEPPKVGNLTDFEIFREGYKSQPRELAMELLRKAEVAYVFENSSVITEAILSGTTVGLVKSSFFDKVIADTELGLDHLESIRFGESVLPAEVKDLFAMRNKYIGSIDIFWSQLETFIEDTQKFATNKVATKRMIIPIFTNNLLTPHRFQLAFQILRTKGPIVLSRTIVNFIWRRIAAIKRDCINGVHGD